MKKEHAPTSPAGTRIEIRPIWRADLGKVLIRCLPDGNRLETLFKTQEIAGFGAWDTGQCIGQLHCYRLVLPHGSTDAWPEWSRPSFLDAVLDGRLGIAGPVWCHACFHVGRSIERFSRSDDPDPNYLGRGIGTALARASVSWAQEHDYKAVIAPGTPDGLFAFSVWAGGLPWTSYLKLGFSDASLGTDDELAQWTRAHPPPPVMAEINASLAEGRPMRDFRSHLMLLRLASHGR